MEALLNEIINKLPEILQTTYFEMNPFNPNNTEDGFQELLRHNIIKVFDCNVDSETTCQKTVLDINGNEIHLKNKTERYDLVIRAIEFIMELKAVEKIDESHVNQLLTYMGNSNYKYGAIINFRKGKSCKQLIAEARIYEKKDTITFTDRYNRTYYKPEFQLIHSNIKTEDYKELVGNAYLSNEIIIT